MSKKTYYIKILLILLNSSLISCWILVLLSEPDRENFLILYISFYFVLLILSIICCLPMILLTDLLCKDWGNWILWTLKFLNYHLPVIVGAPLYIFWSEGYPFIFEIPVIVLIACEAIIKYKKGLTIIVFVTCVLYLIHIILFFIGIILTFSSTP